MEDRIIADENDGWIDGFVAALTDNQTQAREIRTTVRNESRRFQDTLDRQFRELSGVMAGLGQQSDERASEIERREQQLEVRELNVEVRIAHLDQLQQDLARQRGEWLRLQAESAELQQTLLDEIRQQHAQLNECRAVLETERIELECRKHLQRQPAAAQKASLNEKPGLPAEGEDVWEVQKRKMLAKLESECEGDAPPPLAERLKVEEVIRASDRIVAVKQREIDELKKLLEEQSKENGDVAVGAAAIGEVFDHSELIRQERERLRALQEEWHAKLRKAEIEISTERAKLARDKNRLEEKLLAYERAVQYVADSAPECETRKSAPKRWLAKLGFIDAVE